MVNFSRNFVEKFCESTNISSKFRFLFCKIFAKKIYIFSQKGFKIPKIFRKNFANLKIFRHYFRKQVKYCLVKDIGWCFTKFCWKISEIMKVLSRFWFRALQNEGHPMCGVLRNDHFKCALKCIDPNGHLVEIVIS